MADKMIDIRRLEYKSGQPHRCLVGVANIFRDDTNCQARLIYEYDVVSSDSDKSLTLFNTCPICGCDLDSADIKREYSEKIEISLAKEK